MTIFNNIKRGAADAANKAAKKTGEITSIAKLTMNTKSAEAKLGEVYEEIGRLFYTAERTGEDYTSEIASNIMKADKIKADIAGYKHEISVLRNVIVCESCGNEISADSSFCSFCGTKVEKSSPVAEEAPVADVPEEDDGECDCDCGCEEEAEECCCGCENAEEEPCCCDDAQEDAPEENKAE